MLLLGCTFSLLGSSFPSHHVATSSPSSSSSLTNSRGIKMWAMLRLRDMISVGFVSISFFFSLKQLSCDMQSTLFQSTTEYLPPVIQLQPDTSSRPRRWTHAALTYFLHPSMAVATFCSAMVTYWKVRYAGRPSTGSLFLCLSHGLAPAGSGVVGSKILPLEKKTEKYPGFSSPCSELFQRFRWYVSSQSMLVVEGRRHFTWWNIWEFN